MKIRIALAASTALAASLALAQPTAERNGIMTDTGGKTLYTFDKDGGGKSACYGNCAAAWPPAIAASGAEARGDHGLIRRDDGAMQWTYKGKPLYYFAGDTQPGQRLGDGQGGVWHVIAAGTAAGGGAKSGASGAGYSNYGY
jgi:predicted lipoprotein with Yx(FWY)xxD motif